MHGLPRRGAISIHAAGEGGDGAAVYPSDFAYTFQSTPPVRAATSIIGIIHRSRLFQSTPPVRAATLIVSSRSGELLDHFNPRRPWGRRRISRLGTPEHRDFNPRRPWGRRPTLDAALVRKGAFQSTPPVGAATRTAAARGTDGVDFNPRRPWGRRPPA